MEKSLEPGRRLPVHALHLGDRINTSAYDGEILSAVPLAVRYGEKGVAVLFRYGVAVLIAFKPEEERAFLEKISTRVVGRLGVAEEESAFVEIAGGAEDQISAGGPITLGDMSLPRMLIVADALAKSVALASDERDVTKVFGVIEPFAAELAARGRTRRNRTEILKLVGNALLVQHRVSGRVAVAEKPDALWDRHDLERLYARLEDEYELKERVETLDRKLAVIADTAETLADIIDLGDWETYQLRKWSETAEGVARESVSSCPRAGCGRSARPQGVRFASRSSWSC